MAASSADGRVRALEAAGAKARVAPFLIFLEAHAPGRLGVLWPHRKIAQRLQSLRRGALSDPVEDPRGIGVQRQTVRTLLARDPRVTGFGDAPAEAGGWGATWVSLQ